MKICATQRRHPEFHLRFRGFFPKKGLNFRTTKNLAAKVIYILLKSTQIRRDKTNWWAGWKECTNFIIVTCHELELGGVRVAHPVSIGTKIIIQYPRRGRDPSRPAQPRPTKIVNKITKITKIVNKITKNSLEIVSE